MHLCLDNPAVSARCDPLCFRVEGWTTPPSAEAGEGSIEAWLEDVCVGTTRQRFVRADVNAAQGWDSGARAGFSLVAHAAMGPFGRQTTLRVVVRQGTEIVASIERKIVLLETDYRNSDYGILLRQDFPPVHHRESIYTSGPSQATGSEEVVQLIARSLGSPPATVLDIGCGLGWYGGQLGALGYGWHGAEMKAADCASMSASGLPHTRVDGTVLPFSDGAFQNAMAIEVLEHIETLPAFMQEVKRVAPARLFVSVPNAELLPYLRPYLAVPWHMLEADHKNFFTRWSLAAMLRDFYANVEVGLHTEHPLKTPEDTRLYYNLFAIAWD